MENDYKIMIDRQSYADMIGYINDLHTSFKCLSTSNDSLEIINDIDVFRPNAFLCFYKKSDDSMTELLRILKARVLNNNLLYIIVSTPTGCADFVEKMPSFSALMIKLPITPLDLRLTIKQYLDEKCGEFSEDTVSMTKTYKMVNDSFRKKILVVDDDIIALDIIKTILKQDYDITCAENGDMARKCLEANTFDLIMLDYVMPEESGVDLFKKLKDAPKTSKIPVLFLTGVESPEVRKEIIALNPQGYLMKPIDAKRLRTAVKCVLE